MRKNNLLVGAFTMVTLVLTACSNEELPTENPGSNNGNTEVVEGVSTYARFSFKMDGVKHTRATADEE